MASTIYSYNLTGGKVFPVAFEYLARRFVKVTMIGATRQELQLNVDYRFISKTEIETTIVWAPGEFQTIEVRRVTSATDRLVNFTDGSILRSQDLNISQIQAIHIAEEARDVADTSLNISGFNWDAKGLPIKNLGNPELPTDAANGQYVLDNIRTALRVTPSETITEIPSDRANKVLAFDSNRQPIAITPAAGSSTELELRLRDMEDAMRGATMIGFNGRSVRDALTDVVNGRDYGMRNRPGYDNRLAFQKAEAVAKATGRTLWVPGGVHPYEFAAGAQIYQSSTVVLVGDGGCSKSTKFVRMDGSYTDLLIGGEWDEGATHTIVNGIMPYRNGFPYTDTNIGHDIAVRHIFLGGNGKNAGFAPSLGPDTGYRGSNLSMRCIDGITLHDVRSDEASNDCLHVARCRRILITDCWVERNFLIGNRIGATRNGLTVAGTLGGLGFARPDYMVIKNITGIETEDLAVAVQFVTPPGTSTPYAGTVIVDGIFTKDNATYGLGVEVYGSGENQPSRENIIITNVISEGDGTRTGEAYASVLISHRSRAVIASNIIIRKARGSGLVFSGTESIQLGNIMIDEYNLGGFPACKGIFGYRVAPDVPDVCQLANILVRGGEGRGGDTSAIDISGYNHIYGNNVHCNGTSFKTITDNAVIKLFAKHINFAQSSALRGACNGWWLGGFIDFSLIGCVGNENGQAGGSVQRIGFNFGPGTNRTGRVSGCDASDRQAVPTQTIGYLLGLSATDAISITDSNGKGNIQGPVVNLGMPNARIHNNGFQYVGQTQGFRVGGNGHYLSPFIMGTYCLWIERATGKLRIKNGTPTSDNDGQFVGA